MLAKVIEFIVACVTHYDGIDDVLIALLMRLVFKGGGDYECAASGRV